MVACEKHGRVRDAFRSYGAAAFSVDTQPTTKAGPHYCGSVLDLEHMHIDLLIGFPPCTYLAKVAQQYKKYNWNAHQCAVTFFLRLYSFKANYKALENPAGTMNTIFKKPSQIIHPYMFGHAEKKETCLWLVNLPPLQSTTIVKNPISRLGKLGSCPGRSDIRSKTFSGIADAMAFQWLHYLQQTGYINQTERLDHFPAPQRNPYQPAIF